MSNSLQEINKRINTINNLLPTFDTEERKEIKKNNKLINELINELTTYKEKVYKQLLTKKEAIIPQNNTKKIEENNNKILSLTSEINYLNDNNYITKLELDKDLYNIENTKNLENINNSLKQIINKFNLIDIKLSNQNFTYSITLYEYMTEFFNNINTKDFNKIMQDIFDELYWQDPNLIKDLTINLKILINQYSKQFNTYIKNKNNNQKYSEELDKLLNLKIENDKLINTNQYLNYNLFINKELNIEEYLDNSPFKKDTISKFIQYDQYITLSQEDKQYFYKEIRGLYHSINEYLSLINYKQLIDKIKEIYKEKEKYKTNLQTLEKTINNLNKKKDKNNKKLFNIYNKLNTSTKNNKLSNKYNELFNKINIQIQEITNLYQEYNNTLFINDVITKLNDNSTYYDLLKIYTNNYDYLMNLVKENNIEFNYNEFINYIYNPYLVISKSITFNNEIDIKEKITEKYSLHNINFDLNDNTLLELKNSLTYLYKLSYFQETSLDLEQIKIIIDINKINQE